MNLSESNKHQEDLRSADLSVKPVHTGENLIDSMKRISWGSVFAGVLIAIVIQIALSLLGIGIGLSTVDPKEEANPVNGLGTGTAIWYIITSLLTLFAGGWIAGRLAPTRRLFDGIIHGILAWSLITLITLYFITTTIGGILGGVGRLVGNTLGTVGNIAGKGIEAATPAIKDAVKDQGIDLSSLKQEALTLLRQTGKSGLQPKALSKQVDDAGTQVSSTANDAASNPQQADDEVSGLIDRLVNQGKGVTSQVDKDAVVNVIVARTGKSREEASQIADNWVATSKQAAAKWEQTKQEAEAKARDVADKAAKAASTAAILTFVSLALGAVVAGYGAKKGTESKEKVNSVDHTIHAAHT
jgi:hypothetical protein